MPGMYEIRFLPDGPVAEFAGSRGNYYELDDGSHLDMHTTPIWCLHCGKVTHGERIESLEEIDRQLADLNDSNSDLYRMTARGTLHELTGGGDDYLQKRVDELLRRRRWRERRISPAKCILCGSTDIFVFPVNQESPNPAGPGTVEVKIVGMCSTSFNEWFFNSEGNRVPKDTKPTYWHHPELDKTPVSPLRWFNRLFRRKDGPANSK